MAAGQRPRNAERSGLFLQTPERGQMIGGTVSARRRRLGKRADDIAETSVAALRIACCNRSEYRSRPEFAGAKGEIKSWLRQSAQSFLWFWRWWWLRRFSISF